MPGADKGKAKGKNKTKSLLRELESMEEDEEEQEDMEEDEEEQEDMEEDEEEQEEPPSYEAIRVKLQGNPELKEVRLKVQGLQGDTKSPEQVYNLRQRRAPAPPLLSDVLVEAVRKSATQKKAIQKKNRNTRKKKSESEQSSYLRELHEYKNRHFDSMNEQDKYGLTKAIEYVEEEENAKMDYDTYLEEQVDYLRDSKDEKKFFVLTIFERFIDDEHYQRALKKWNSIIRIIVYLNKIV